MEYLPFIATMKIIREEMYDHILKGWSEASIKHSFSLFKKLLPATYLFFIHSKNELHKERFLNKEEEEEGEEEEEEEDIQNPNKKLFPFFFSSNQIEVILQKLIVFCIGLEDDFSNNIFRKRSPLVIENKIRMKVDLYKTQVYYMASEICVIYLKSLFHLHHHHHMHHQKNFNRTILKNILRICQDICTWSEKKEVLFRSFRTVEYPVLAIRNCQWISEKMIQEYNSERKQHPVFSQNLMNIGSIVEEFEVLLISNKKLFEITTEISEIFERNNKCDEFNQKKEQYFGILEEIKKKIENRNSIQHVDSINCFKSLVFFHNHLSCEHMKSDIIRARKKSTLNDDIDSQNRLSEILTEVMLMENYHSTKDKILLKWRKEVINRISLFLEHHIIYKDLHFTEETIKKIILSMKDVEEEEKEVPFDDSISFFINNNNENLILEKENNKKKLGILLPNCPFFPFGMSRVLISNPKFIIPELLDILLDKFDSSFEFYFDDIMFLYKSIPKEQNLKLVYPNLIKLMKDWILERNIDSAPKITCIKFLRDILRNDNHFHENISSQDACILVNRLFLEINNLKSTQRRLSIDLFSLICHRNEDYKDILRIFYSYNNNNVLDATLKMNEFGVSYSYQNYLGGEEGYILEFSLDLIHQFFRVLNFSKNLEKKADKVFFRLGYIEKNLSFQQQQEKKVSNISNGRKKKKKIKVVFKRSVVVPVETNNNILLLSDSERYWKKYLEFLYLVIEIYHRKGELEGKLLKSVSFIYMFWRRSDPLKDGDLQKLVISKLEELGVSDPIGLISTRIREYQYKEKYNEQKIRIIDKQNPIEEKKEKSDDNNMWDNGFFFDDDNNNIKLPKKEKKIDGFVFKDEISVSKMEMERYVGLRNMEDEKKFNNKQGREKKFDHLSEFEDDNINAKKKDDDCIVQ